MLTYITGAPGATLGFADRLVVGSEALAGLAAPVNSAGKLVLGLAGRLMKHFLAAQVAAEDLPFRRSNGRIHNQTSGLCRRSEHRPLDRGFHKLDLIAVLAERLRALCGRL